MGGNAIKAVGAMPIRVDKKVYEEIVGIVIRIINESPFKLHKIKELQTFNSKEDFGDLDVLVSFESGFEHQREEFDRYLNLHLNVNNFKPVVNGPVTSFVWGSSIDKHFQVDINYIPASGFEIAYAYHGNGDLGNLVGRIFHNLGVKFGHDGLTYIHRNETYIVGEILLSDNVVEIFASIGLVYDKNHVFQTEQEVFDFVVSSPFFHPNFYQLELRNHTARVRDKKRPSYTRFVEFINSLEFREKPLASKDFHTVLIESFGCMDQYMRLVEKESNRLYNKAVCDPLFVSQMSGLKNAELGELMKAIKSRIVFNKTMGFAHNRKHLVEFIQAWVLVMVN